MKDFMNMYTSLVERCFTSCCNDFTSKALSSKEVSLRRALSVCSGAVLTFMFTLAGGLRQLVR